MVLTRLKRRVAAGALVVAAAGAVVAAVTFGQSGSSQPGRPPGSERAAGIDPALASAFGVFRRGQRTTDRPPQARADLVPDGGNVALARRASAPSGNPIYLVPGAGSVCVADKDLAGSCVGIDQAKAGYAVTWAPCAPGTLSGQIRIVGLVPDGVAEATLVLSDGRRMSVPVVENAYEFVTPGRTAAPVEVHWRAGDGVDHAIPTPVTPDELGLCRRP